MNLIRRIFIFEQLFGINVMKCFDKVTNIFIFGAISYDSEGGSTSPMSNPLLYTIKFT